MTVDVKEMIVSCPALASIARVVIVNAGTNFLYSLIVISVDFLGLAMS